MTAVASLGFRTDLMLRRLAGASVEDRGDYLVIRTTANPTFYWGNFLLFREPPKPGEPTEWVSTFGREFPDATHVAIGVDGTTGALGAAPEMRLAGLADEVSVVLTTDVLTPIGEPDPAAELRVLRTDEEWAQSVEFRIAVDEDESDQHRLFVERRSRELRDLVEAGHGVYVGAFVDGVARAGLGLYVEDGIARFQSVETHPLFRRRGLASALLVEAARLVSEQHPVETFVIVADPSYVAIDLYRRLGFADSERQVQWLRSPEPAD
jgi:ribosomal protein S18 acetylase RimI-like enzyme